MKKNISIYFFIFFEKLLEKRITFIKIVTLFLFLNVFSFSLCKSQTTSDSCDIVDRNIPTDGHKNDTIYSLDSLLWVTDSSNTDMKLNSSKENISNQILRQNMEKNKEKFFNKKRVIILTSLVALQVAFGFDPKFTAINLIWLLF
jgi:hypothetical protein